MQQFCRYSRVGSLIVAFGLFLLPVISPPSPVDFFADHMSLLAIFVLGLGARSWLEAIITGVVCGMVALSVYALFGFGWFHAALSVDQNVTDSSWSDAAVDIVIWTPAIAIMAASAGYGLRRVLCFMLKRWSV